MSDKDQEHKEVRAILKNSVLCMDIVQRDSVWDTVTCQDVLHSLYCTHTELKALKCEEAFKVVRKLRRFFVIHHSKLFKNKVAYGTVMVTVARRYVREKHRLAFLSDFERLQTVTERHSVE